MPRKIAKDSSSPYTRAAVENVTNERTAEGLRVVEIRTDDTRVLLRVGDPCMPPLIPLAVDDQVLVGDARGGAPWIAKIGE